MTMYEKIKRMSLEEMAKFFSDIMDCEPCYAVFGEMRGNGNKCGIEKSCYETFIEILNSEKEPDYM